MQTELVADEKLGLYFAWPYYLQVSLVGKRSDGQ